MADNGHAPSLSQLSQSSDEDNSSDHSPGSFATLSGGGGGNGSVIIGGARGYPSLSNHNTNNKPPPQPPSAGYRILPHEANNEQQPQQVLITPSKRPRGRPPGSKNKPKPPIVIKQESDHALKPVVIEVPTGNDVVEALITFARRRRLGISILSGSGSVSDVTLRHPLSRAPVFPIHGPFHMLSLTGTYISSGRFPALLSSNPATFPACSSFGICLAGSQGQVFGGVVAGKVIAASLVVVMATVFRNPEFHRVMNGNADEEVDEEEDDDDDAYAGVINADHSGVGVPSGITNNNNSNSNNNAIALVPNNMSAFGVANSTPLNGQVPVADHVNVMQWNHPTHLP